MIRYHGVLDKRLSGKAGVMAVFERLRSIQYDPLDVVTRNADLVLAARVRDYRPAYLYELLYREHALIDGWDKMMCIYPATDFNRFALLRRAREDEIKNVLAWRHQTEALSYLDDVRAHIAENGASAGADIPTAGLARSRWGHGRASSAALDYLFHTGELCVADKNGALKRFDLTARVLPPAALFAPGFSDMDAFLRWYVLRRVASMGLVWNKNGGAWLGCFLEKKEPRGGILDFLAAEGTLTRITVDGLREPLYCKTEDLPLFDAAPLPNRVRFLAPLDNMLWDRALVQALFGFSYSWEVYVPEKKRRYGYYVLPILCGERFMGRMEPEPYRRGGAFVAKNIWFEEGFSMTAQKKAALNAAMEDFSAYLARG